MTQSMKQLIEEHLTSATHLSKRHIHPRLHKMFEMGGMSAAFTRAAGQYAWSADGARYLDLLAGGGVYFIGRNHPKIHAALRDVLDLELPNLSVVNASVLGGLAWVAAAQPVGLIAYAVVLLFAGAIVARVQG